VDKCGLRCRVRDEEAMERYSLRRWQLAGCLQSPYLTGLVFAVSGHFRRIFEDFGQFRPFFGPDFPVLIVFPTSEHGILARKSRGCTIGHRRIVLKQDVRPQPVSKISFGNINLHTLDNLLHSSSSPPRWYKQARQAATPRCTCRPDTPHARSCSARGVLNGVYLDLGILQVCPKTLICWELFWAVSVDFCRFWSISTVFEAGFFHFCPFSDFQTRYTRAANPTLYYSSSGKGFKV
jgi:hypothetical protein